jgi:hypothetical protein
MEKGDNGTRTPAVAWTLFFSGKYKQIEAHEPINAWSISSDGW